MIDKQKDLAGTARITGFWYFILAVTGMLGFLIFHPRIYISNDPVKTLENLNTQESLARIRLLLEFAIIVSQALTAAWFYKLFKHISDWGAWAVGIWGTINSAVIMISAISMGSALEIANSSTLSYDNKIVLIQLAGQLIANAWGVGSLFFGLWLIPMGYSVLKSNRIPTWLGRILIIGGFGYILSTFIKYMGFNNPLIDALTIPATIGEFWMIGYLLIYGIRVSKDESETFKRDQSQ